MPRLTELLAGACLLVATVAACGTDRDEKTATPAAPTTVTVTASPSAGPTTSSEPPPATTPTTTPRPEPRPKPVDLSGLDLPGFTTPSGNIGCQFDDYQGRAHVRCDRLQMDAIPSARPADCDFDWGHSVELSAGDRAALACTSDSVMGQQGETDGTRALPYGDSVRYRGIVCTSSQQGLHCHSTGGHGFLLSRETIRVR